MTSSPFDGEDIPPEIALALGYASADLRPGFDALLRFDLRLGRAVSASKDAQLARIRLAWWRDEIEAAEHEARPANDPVLAAVCRVVRRRDVSSGHLIRIIEGWAELLDELPLTRQTISSYALGRGGGIFAAGSVLAGSSAPENAGQAFALVDFARNCSDAVSRDRALLLASQLPVEKNPRQLRPFALLDNWARRDAALILRGKLPLSLRRRAFSALTFALTGPRLYDRD